MSPSQPEEAWRKIHADTPKRRNFIQEWYDLRDHWIAKKFRPYTNNVGKRHAKGRATGVGTILKQSRVIPQVGIERVFTPFR